MEELAKLVFMIIAVSSTEIMPSHDWHGIVKRACSFLTVNTNS